MLQDSKASNVSRSDVVSFWGKNSFGWDYVDSVGLSGGLISIWDDSLFCQIGGSKSRQFLHVKGSVKGCATPVNFLNVYAPQGVPAKKVLWDELKIIIESNDGFWVIAGDFNAVRFREEKRNCSFKQSCANNFNEFIFETGLIEYNMSNRRFTFCSENGSKLSKLDRFLVNSDFFNAWPAACCRVLPRRWSDHNPIILSCIPKNFGPRPFRIFNSWFGKSGFADTVLKANQEFASDVVSPDLFFLSKLRFIRDRIRGWKDDMVRKEGEDLETAKSEYEALEAILDSREFSEEEE
ncbi:uncharacterized protein LOC110870189 [Helianthus annuus]|uniref:uncharacterized protein LOC110870189 n=1 Tax=Helianthus annuus TaxID=4232 RepID=UPI000B8F9D9D|nr:uncharacterized protein LOC110870189 [Helianthus annuus]